MNGDLFKEKTVLVSSHVDIDFIPLHDIFRSLYGLDNLTPTAKQFQKTLDFIMYLVENKIIVALDEDMKKSNVDLSRLIQFLQNKFNDGKYDEISYGIWFDTPLNHTIH